MGEGQMDQHWRHELGCHQGRVAQVWYVYSNSNSAISSIFWSDLHPLALEDVFHTRSQTRSKVDYYTKHLFLRILVHEVGDPDDIPPPFHATAAYGSTLTGLPRSSSPTPFEDGDSIEMKDSGLVEDDRTVFGEITPMSTMRNRKGRGTFKSADPEKGSSTFSRLSKIALLDAVRTTSTLGCFPLESNLRLLTGRRSAQAAGGGGNRASGLEEGGDIQLSAITDG